MALNSSTTLGLLGTGKIGSAVFTGFCSPKTDEDWTPAQVYISRRSQAKSAALKEAFASKVTVEDDSQKIIDQSDVIFIGLLPDVARSLLPTLKFPKDKKIVSMMATIPYEELLGLVQVPKENVIRTVPLPSASKRSGPILAYPENEFGRNLLQTIGTPVMVNDEKEMTTLTSLTSFISFFYATEASFHDWFVNNGVSAGPARAFIASFFKSLAEAGFASSESFHDMAEEAATPGGLNEQVHTSLTKRGGYDTVIDEIDEIYRRLAKAEPAPRDSKKVDN